MTPLLELFLSEARDFLQGIGEKLMQLEDAPADTELMAALFRMVHTLKGNSGLFEFPEMTRVLHAGEDLMDGVRHGRVEYSKELADRLLDAMDFVGMLCDEIEAQGGIGAAHVGDSARLAKLLRQLLPSAEAPPAPAAKPAMPTGVSIAVGQPLLADIPEHLRMEAYRRACAGDDLHWLDYVPAEDCFFLGDDPFFNVRNTPELLWGGIVARQPWPKLAKLDVYRCALDYHLLSAAPRQELDEHFCYILDQVSMVVVQPLHLALPQGAANGGLVYDDFVAEALELLTAGNWEALDRAARSLLELSGPGLWSASALRWLLLVMELEPANGLALRSLVESLRDFTPPQWHTLLAEAHGGDCAADAPEYLLTQEETAVLTVLVAVQRNILSLPIEETWHLSRLKAVSATLAGCLRACGDFAALAGLDAATAAALDEAAAAPLLVWLDGKFGTMPQDICAQIPHETRHGLVELAIPIQADPPEDQPDRRTAPTQSYDAEASSKFGRRAEDAIVASKSIKVDQAKIDRLMNLIGEMVVSKNALPYLAVRAEDVFGARELSREIKTQYAVINRIAEEMQDAIMQIRMLPVSFVFQRFPRLVRDISHKLGKEVNLVLEGEDTEADKNIIEALGDPLVHIVRNSLDHGLELPEVRRAVGKPAAGKIIIRASQESDRVVIEISDDGKGIDPTAIKNKAYQQGLIEEAALDRLSDQEAVNLIFESGFSTVEVVSDLSGRGVGMDVVRNSVEKVNGTVMLESEKGKGTLIRLSLPLSMAVTNVMIVESDGQSFGMPMDCVVETVRVKRSAIRSIKNSLATVLRGRIVPLKPINALLGLEAKPKTNADDEFAVLVVRIGDEPVGLLVDNFRETVDIILKPMTGVLTGISAYSGSALMGDGSVLMVLNVKGML